MSPLLAAIVAVMTISLIELIAIIVLAVQFWSQRLEVRLVSFAAGVLLATVFLDLLPEAAEGVSDLHGMFTAILVAMIGLFVLERLTRRDHSHDVTTAQHHHHHHPKPPGSFVIFGDGLHSAIDGFAIAASFIVSPQLGVVTTLAVLAHELPHQIGDYSILRNRGYGRYRALIINLTSAVAAVVGVLLTFAFQTAVEDHLNLFIGFTAGMLLYIAAVQLLPELLHGRAKGRFLYFAPFSVGVLLIAGLVQLLHG